MKGFGILTLALAAAALASVSVTEVAPLPSSSVYGADMDVGTSQLIAATYNAGEGPGIWIVSDGGYRLFLNGELLAEDNQAGRVRFVPMTFLPGENAVSVVATNTSGGGGVRVQIDELEKSYYSGSGWYAKPYVSSASYMAKGRDLSAWGGATSYGTSAPSGISVSGFDSNSEAEWIWTDDPDDTLAVLLYTFNIKAEGFGEGVTGGEDGTVVIASDSASVRKYLQQSGSYIILVPEGTYDFRQWVNAATSASSSGWTWCASSCSSGDVNSSNTFYRVNFYSNSCDELGSGLTIVSEADGLQSWNNWITTKNGNKSLIGMGRGANLRGASITSRTAEGNDNNIFRNLAFYDVNPHLIEAGDGLDVVGTDDDYVEGFWADHISYKWISDGLDLENLKAATVSYLYYDGANEYNCYYYDPYMHLVQNAELTMANNYWANTYGRIPKIASDNFASTVHIYNSYVEYNYWHIVDISGSSSYNSQLLYENNYMGRVAYTIIGKDEYSSAYVSNVTYDSQSASVAGPYYNSTAGTYSSTPFTDNVFTPSYDYELLSTSEVPAYVQTNAGAGGRWGTMPEYDQDFGISNYGPSVSLTSPAEGDELSETSVTLTASASDSEGSIARVDFYLGTTLVGSATSSPYSVTVSDLSEGGTYSAVAIAVDNEGIEQMSDFVTFSVAGTLTVGIYKCGGGSSTQAITLGDSIASFCYYYENASGITVEGLPSGLDTASSSTTYNNGTTSYPGIRISGTPTEAGTFSFVATASGDYGSATKKGTITVSDTSSESSSSTEGSSESEASSSDASGFGMAKLSTGKAVEYVRIFDVQGRPLYSGSKRPAKLPAAQAIVIEYDAAGGVVSRRLERAY